MDRWKSKEVSPSLLKNPGPSKILLPRFDTHGDIILLKSFIDVVLDMHPDAEVTLLVREGYNELASLFSDQLLWRTEDWQSSSRYSDEQIASIISRADRLALEAWDLVLFTSYNRTFLDDLLAAKLAPTTSIALGRESLHDPWQRMVLNKLGLGGSHLYSTIIPVDEHLHEIEKYRLLAEHLWGVDAVVGQPRIEVPASIRSSTRDLLRSLDLDHRPFAICMPAGTQNVAIKSWPSESFAETVKWLATNRQLPSLLIGHEQEKSMIEAVKNHCEERGSPVRVWLGKKGELPLLAGLINRASLYFGNDSGPMHLAAALGIPTLGIFGGGTWPRFTANGPNTLSVKALVPCDGCAWDCPFNNAYCLRAITPDAVRSAIESLLETPSSSTEVSTVTPSLNPDILNLMAEASASHRELKTILKQRQDVIDELSLAYEAVNAAYQSLISTEKRGGSFPGRYRSSRNCGNQ
jgi:ADP-heptose:LPS heptosyltransferase